MLVAASRSARRGLLCTFALARYNPDGSLDASFDGDGLVLTRFFGENVESATALVIQSNAKIVVAGTVYSSFDPSFALARYLADGRLDGDFGVGGKATTDFGDPADVGVLCPSGRKDCSEDRAADLALQPDGKIVAVGGAGPCVPPCYFSAARYAGDAIAVDLAPELTVPDAITADATGAEGAVVSSLATATGDHDPAPVVECSPASGSTFPIGTTTVACSATDTNSNSASASFPVHVLAGRDVVIDVRGKLAQLPPTDNATDDKLARAVRLLDRSLEERIWTDSLHPSERHGNKVFDAQRDAARALIAIRNPDQAITDAISRLATETRVLAEIAINEAASGHAGHLTHAADELAKGDKARTAGHQAMAIAHYRKAWRKAIRA